MRRKHSIVIAVALLVAPLLGAIGCGHDDPLTPGDQDLRVVANSNIGGAPFYFSPATVDGRLEATAPANLAFHTAHGAPTLRVDAELLRFDQTFEFVGWVVDGEALGMSAQLTLDGMTGMHSVFAEYRMREDEVEVYRLQVSASDGSLIAMSPADANGTTHVQGSGIVEYPVGSLVTATVAPGTVCAFVDGKLMGNSRTVMLKLESDMTSVDFVYARSLTLPGSSLSTIRRMCGFHCGGDCEYAGHGVVTEVVVKLRVEMNSIIANVSWSATEDRSDYTSKCGNADFTIWTASSGELLGLDMPTTVFRSSDTLLGHGVHAMPTGSFVAKLGMVGDTSGNDACACTADDTQLWELVWGSMRVLMKD